MLGVVALSFLTGGEHGFVTAQLTHGDEMPISEFADPNTGPDLMAKWLRDNEDHFDGADSRLLIMVDANTVTMVPASHSDEDPHGDHEMPGPGEKHTHGEIVINLGTGKMSQGVSPNDDDDDGDDGGDPESKVVRHVRDAAFWDAPVGTPLPLARRVKPPVKYRGGSVDAVRRIPKEPAPINTTGMTGAEIMAAVIHPELTDSINVKYIGGQPPSNATRFVLPMDYSKSKWNGTTGFNPHEYQIRRPSDRPVRPVHPLERHDTRDIKWPYSDKPNAVLWTDQEGNPLIIGINTIIDTSPPNPKTPGLAKAVQMWVEGRKSSGSGERDFPYVGEIRTASNIIMGLKQPRHADTRPVQRRQGDYNNKKPYSEAEVMGAAQAIIDGIAAAPPEQPDLFRGVERRTFVKHHPGDKDEYITKAGMDIPAVGDTFTIPPSSFSRDPEIASMYAGSAAYDKKKKGSVPSVIIHVVAGSRGIKDDKWITTDQEVITGGTYKVTGVSTYTGERWESFGQKDRHGDDQWGPSEMVYRKYETTTIIIDVEQVDVPHAKS